jgi:type I restriction enzyme, S subunit
MFELPKSWINAKLNDVADILDFEREPINSAERAERIAGKDGSELYPYYGATGKVGWIDGYRTEGQRVLLGEDAAPFLDSVKDKAYLARGRFWANNHVHVLRGAVGFIDDFFLCYQLNNVDYHPFVSGSTRLKLTNAAMKQLPLVVAPTAEQTRIVAKLEELFSDLDAGVAELKAAKKKLGQYRQSLLKAAVEGALTADWRQHNPPTETGAQLLERILTERRSRWEARQLAKFKEQGKAAPKDWESKYPEPVTPDRSGLPDLPEGWVWASVDQLSPNDLANGRSVPSSEAGAKVLRLTAVKSGRIDLNEFKCGDWSENQAKQFAVAEGDLLIVRGNGSLSLVGRAGLVGKVSGQVAYPDTMIRLRVVEAVVSSSWIGLVWNASVVRTHLERRARTSAGIYKISQPDIVSAFIPVPPLDEQEHIEGLFGQKLEELNSIQLAIETGLKQSAAQRKNILKAAFSGQLVPQDPADEPASVLLERIRAEREARGLVKKPRGRKTKEPA